MSFSICIKCETMVGNYEKYCNNCIKTHNLKQDKTWHRRSENWYGEYDINIEFEKDKLKT